MFHTATPLSCGTYNDPFMHPNFLLMGTFLLLKLLVLNHIYWHDALAYWMAWQHLNWICVQLCCNLCIKGATQIKTWNFATLYFSLCHAGCKLSIVAHTSSSIASALPEGSWGFLRLDGICNTSSIFWGCPCGHLSVGCALNHNQNPNILLWFISMQGSSRSTSSSLRMSEQLTLSLRVSERNLFRLPVFIISFYLSLSKGHHHTVGEGWNVDLLINPWLLLQNQLLLYDNKHSSALLLIQHRLTCWSHTPACSHL